MRERFPQRQDSNLRHPNDNRNDKSQRDYSHMISSRPSSVLHEARSRRHRRSSKSSYRRNARGIQVPVT
jgi:hypothetical protein